jgi:lipid II:glycine glycyltransferase (peptidoglycan interpeptide bridge formation enzyme)
MNLSYDIYYSKEYISLYLKDDEEIFEFEYKEGRHLFHNIAIKRPIKKIGNKKIDDGYFDLETVYGYGGFNTNTEDEAFISKALSEYEKKCKNEKIIAEFIRFHTFNEFPISHSNYLDMNIYDRDVVYVDLTLSRDERWKNYSTKTRNILRKCERELTFVRSDNIKKFIELYEKTMDKNNANEFYYFPKSYFEKLMKNKDIELYEIQKDGVVISSAFFMFSDAFGHYHLSANNYEMRQYNANYFILDKIFDVAKEKQKKYFILGGGTTSFKDDSLLKFKQKFSKERKPFYISGKIFNQKIYDEYTIKWKKQSINDIPYFLKYRLRTL